MGYSSRNQQLMDAHAGLLPAHLGASLGALTRLPASATPSSPAANQEEGRREADLKQRSRSFGRSSSGQEPGVWGIVCVCVCACVGVRVCVGGWVWVGLVVGGWVWVWVRVQAFLQHLRAICENRLCRKLQYSVCVVS